MKTILTLPDGREISSGAPGTAVVSARLTRQVNDQRQLCPGAVIPAELQLRLTEAADLDLHLGQRLRLEEEIFVIRSLSRQGYGLLDIVAQDELCLLEKDLTRWLSEKTDWPCSLKTLAMQVLSECGLTLAEEFPNGHCPVEKFTARNVTGAQLMGWIAQLAGCFCEISAAGQVRLGWYTPAQTRLRYYPETLIRGAEPAARVERVELKRTSADAPVAWPEGSSGNTFRLSGNYLLATMEEPVRQALAQSLYDRLSAAAYTPCQLETPENILPGQILQILDPKGQSLQLYVMKTLRQQGRTRVICTAGGTEAGRDLGTFQGTTDAILELEADVEGLRVAHADAAGRASQMELDLEGIRTQVTHGQETEQGITQRLSAVEQTADSLEITLRRVTEEGTDRVVTRSGYRFTDEGLVIRRQGEQMGNRMDHTGMYVTRDEETILRANHQGVEAVDVAVRNYLEVGDHARFQDYETGTACFYT